MKKLLALILVLPMLVGCGNQEEQPDSATGTTAPVQTGLYAPDSKVEQQTGGQVRAYPLPGEDYTVAVMGNKLLLEQAGTLRVLYGEAAEETAVLVTGLPHVDFSAPGTDVAAQGAAYYLSDSREVVLLNPQLQEINRIALPETLQTEPAVSLEAGTIYYCLPNQIRAMDIQTGVSRLLKTHSALKQELTGCWLDGTVLGCRLGEQMLYIDTATGKTLSQDQETYALYTFENRYFACRQDGRVSQMITGALAEQPQLFNGFAPASDGQWTYAPVLELDGVAAYYETEQGITLAFSPWAETAAQVVLPEAGTPVDVFSDGKDLWLLTDTGLYRWDVSKAEYTLSGVQMQTLFTAQSPDTENLSLCEDRADAMNTQYGVRIYLWEDAVAETGGYDLQAEHQVSVLNQMLDDLEPALALFPAGFLQRTVEKGWVKVCLVRQIADNENGFVQFWSGGHCYIVIDQRADTADAFLQLIGYAVDSHVLGNSRDYDEWNSLNPPEFSYLYENPNIQKAELLDSFVKTEDSAFMDLNAVDSPSDDRCRIFYYAVTGQGKTAFETERKQLKLKRLCEGIREAYGLEKDKQSVFIWEQYLTLPLNYDNINP